MTSDGDCGEQDCDEGCSHKPKLKNIRIEVGWLSPSFSRQAKASELSLVFWLNENVPLQTVIVAHIQVYHPFPASLLHYVRRHPLSVSPE